MEVKVLEVLKGKESRKNIRIWGDNGAQCRPYVSGFPQGTEWVFAIRRIRQDSAAPDLEKRGDYDLSVCGGYWLQVEGEQAKGDVSNPILTEPKQQTSLSELRNHISQWKD